MISLSWHGCVSLAGETMTANRTSPTGGEANQVGQRDVNVFFFVCPVRHCGGTHRPLLVGSVPQAWRWSRISSLWFAQRRFIFISAYCKVKEENNLRCTTQNRILFKINAESYWWVFNWDTIHWHGQWHKNYQHAPQFKRVYVRNEIRFLVLN